LDDRALTEWFLDRGADPNAMCEWDLTPMSMAMWDAPMDTIRLLFERGGDIIKGQLLHNAVRHRKTPDVFELVNLLLDKGMPVNDIQYKHHYPSWMINCPFYMGTPLHYAASEGNLELVKLLLSRGADPTIKNSNDKSLLQLAERYKRAEVVDFLKKNFDQPI
jgi:ankyrin repeat protein